MSEKTNLFIKKAQKVHNYKYDYSKCEYVTAKTKMCIICPIHGEFWQSSDKHLKGQGCPYCANKKINKSRQITTEMFIQRSKEKYGNNFSYEKCEVKNMHEKIIITCNLHGDFEITPSSHLKKYGGCKKCLQINNQKKYQKNIEQFIEESKNVHSNKYDYSKVKYVNNHTKVCIICPKHGEFWQTPSKHISRGDGCPICRYEVVAQKNKLSKEEFIAKAQQIHQNKYDYSKVEYKSYDEQICIICPIHGEFWQTPDSHLQGSGCQKCSYSISKCENEIIEYITPIIPIEIRNRTILKPKELDIYIPSKQIAIEYNGLRWHSEEFNKDKLYHLNKTLECNNKGIKLLQIFEDEFIEHKDIVLNKISHILGIQQNLPKIMGRKCKVEIISKDIAEQFLNDYHIQGYARSTIYLGAIYEDKLIAVMTFKVESKNSSKWELTRFASDYHYVCQGVGGKLFNWFIKHYDPSEVKSFADRRWTLSENNNLYTKLGFKLDSILKPDYEYILKSNPKKRIHKFNFRKQILHERYCLPLDMTENEMIKELGYCKIWNCGLFKFKWKREE
jgi:hypothetical protein